MMHVIGIDIGGTRIRAGLIDRQGRVIQTTVLRTADHQDPTAILAAVCDAAYAIIRGSGNVIGVAVAMPGVFDDRTEIPSLSSNLAFLQNVDLREQVESRLEWPTVLETDANAAALAEYRLGAGRESDRLLVVSVGTGVGVGVLLGGQLAKHTRGTGGSLGHVVINAGGPECGCGGKGCVEALSSGKALLEKLNIDAGKAGDSTWSNIITRLNDHDAEVTAAVERIGQSLGVGVAGWLAVYHPDRVVLRGGVSSLGSPWVDAVEQSMREVGAPYHTQAVSICTGQLGDDAGMIGAGLCYFDKVAKD